MKKEIEIKILNTCKHDFEIKLDSKGFATHAECLLCGFKLIPVRC